MSEPTPFLTRTGRIVWGQYLYDPRTTDYDGKPLKDGQQFWEFALAIAKVPGETHWCYSQEGAVIWAQGHKDHPQMAQRPDFSWKVQDGDSTMPNKKGNKPCDNEGYPGHWVYTFRSGYPVKFVNADGSAYLLDRNAVKAGDYVQVAGSVLGNTGATPGVYLNHQAVSLQGLGKAIVGGIDIKAVGFGKGPQPAGMMPVGTPATGSTPPPPAGQPAPPVPGPAYSPPPPAAAQMVPQVPVTPAPGFVTPPAPGGAPPPPPAMAPSGPRMTAKAAGMSYAQFIAAGWTDATLKANGYMEAF